MHARNAKLPDAFAIEQLIQVHVGDGTLLPRSLAEICENIRDFIVVENDGEIVGCGALHLYGMHLAEIRSITVTSQVEGQGRGPGADRRAAEGGAEAERDLRLPVHAHSRFLRANGFRGGGKGSAARQDAQRLPEVPAAATPATRSRCIMGTLPKIRPGRAAPRAPQDYVQIAPLHA